MRIVRADAMGMCALEQALREPNPSEVTIHGELVHNGEVLNLLEQRGFLMTRESERETLPSTPRVLVTAHGISDSERTRLTSAGATLIDTTCPLVAKVHTTATRFAESGRFVVVIGVPGHVEVRGITGDLEHFDVVPTPDHVNSYPATRIGVVCQTTFRIADARQILTAIENANPDADVQFADTVCDPTRQRIRAAEDLSATTDVVVVVGGKNSNNSRQLVDLCESHGTPAHLVQGPRDLDPEWFFGCTTVGLTAGTSTLQETVDDVFEALCALPGAEPEPTEGVAR